CLAPPSVPLQKLTVFLLLNRDLLSQHLYLFYLSLSFS
ncbi:hypothetical protein CP8484711_1500, partial [Chlamydia psittaci 84-8471/1]